MDDRGAVAGHRWRGSGGRAGRPRAGADLGAPGHAATTGSPTGGDPDGARDGYTLGDPDASVTVEVWEDFQCPFCQRFTFLVEPGIVERYVRSGDVRLVFRNLPFLGDEFAWAAVAASLAADQNLFWPFRDYLFANLLGENVGSYDLDRLLAIGEVVGLDMAEFRRGLALDNARARFAEFQREALEDAAALGINSTPTVTVDGTAVASTDLETVSAAIEAALSREPGPSAAPNG